MKKMSVKRDRGPLRMQDFDFRRLEATEGSLENHKRRRALSPFSGALDEGSRMFFDRVLSVRKIREFIFISSARAKAR